MELTDANRQYVLRTVSERGVRFVRLWFVDVLGLLKSFAIPATELEAALSDGVGLDGSALESFARLAERDVIAHPDPHSFQVLPWRPGSVVARMMSDIRLPDGTPFAGDSRHALARVLSRAAELGLTLSVGAEIEFFLFKDEDDPTRPPVPLDQGAYFDLTPLDDGSDFRRATIDYLEQMGIPVKASHHEVAPSQHEIKLAHTDALSMADAVTTFRLVVKEVAREQGVYATFMPKPLEHESGSGMHVHLSLFEGERNVFFDPDNGPLSETGRAFLTGVLAHAAELTAVTNQWVNSYKRLADGFEAPERITWTTNSGAALVRIPGSRPDRESATRIELRSPDSAANPYLVFALTLAAGLRGIERGYQLPAETIDDGAPAAAARLPENLGEAVNLFDNSELVRETLGDGLVEWYVRNKRAEWDAYRRTVTEFERRRYLRSL
ncbi:MAG: glutamine synthetase [Solirubrobacterales bacterium]|nr:glutamine synthetase [Solirubrobacterales bacterium]